MRQIKFRAWDKTEKRWVDPHSFAVYGDGGTTTWGVYNPIVVSQFTGFLDCRGTEIYEGDKIMLTNERDVEIKGPVVFEDGCFWVKAGEIGFYPFHCFEESDEWEIIGNIYENPDLVSQ